MRELILTPGQISEDELSKLPSHIELIGRVHKQLPKDEWSFLPEDPALKKKVQETVVKDGIIKNRGVKCRLIPESNLWFETAWADCCNGKIYQ